MYWGGGQFFRQVCFVEGIIGILWNRKRVRIEGVRVEVCEFREIFFLGFLVQGCWELEWGFSLRRIYRIFGRWVEFFILIFLQEGVGERDSLEFLLGRDLRSCFRVWLVWGGEGSGYKVWNVWVLFMLVRKLVWLFFFWQGREG